MFFDKAPKNNKPEFNRSGEAHSFELWDKCFSEADAGNFVPVIEKNEKGEILAPNGMVSRLPNEDLVKVTRTPTFKAWFGDWVNDPENASKVVYEDTGEPMVVYHGTNRKIKVEEGIVPKFWIFPERIFINQGYLKTNAHFTNEMSQAYAFGRIKNIFNKPTVFSLFLRVTKPVIIDSLISFKGILNHDNDGIIHTYGSFFGWQVIVQHNSQIMHLPSDIEWRIRAGK